MDNLSLKLADKNITTEQLKECTNILDKKIYELYCLQSLLELILSVEEVVDNSDLIHIALKQLNSVLEV